MTGQRWKLRRWIARRDDIEEFLEAGRRQKRSCGSGIRVWTDYGVILGMRESFHCSVCGGISLDTGRESYIGDGICQRCRGLALGRINTLNNGDWCPINPAEYVFHKGLMSSGPHVHSPGWKPAGGE